MTFEVLGKKEPETLRITVRDTGVGFHTAGRGGANHRKKLEASASAAGGSRSSRG